MKFARSLPAIALLVIVSTAVILIATSRISSEAPLLVGSASYALYDAAFDVDHPLSLYLELLSRLSLSEVTAGAITFGLLSLLLGWMLLRRYNLGYGQSLFILAVWAISYTFLGSLFSSGIIPAAFCILFGASLLFLMGRRILAGVFLLLLPLISPIVSLGAYVLFLLFCSFDKRSLRSASLVLMPSVVVFVVIVYEHLRKNTLLFLRPQVSVLFQELGVYQGAPLLLFLLSLGGALFFWRRALKVSYILGGIQLVLATLFPVVLPFASLLVTLLAARTFLLINQASWKLELSRKAFTVIFLLAIIFSTMTGMLEIIHEDPRAEQMQSLQALEELSSAKILTDPEIAPIVSVLSAKETYPASAAEHRTALVVLRNPSFFAVTDFLAQNNISYIYVTADMLSGNVWNHTDQGLLLVLTNNNTFTEVYEDGYAQIYHFKDLQNQTGLSRSV
ncbi:MAG: hypothetical protein ACOCWQ_04170 [Nanoarchaeota archaeon]